MECTITAFGAGRDEPYVAVLLHNVWVRLKGAQLWT